ncbi:MAG: LptF/LptG family permease [Akkermansiaceae bacterium]|nr:LptF/LptG family permease [Akkermansiaceae bacterium]
MRISDRYIGKQVLLGTVYAVLVLGVVLVLGNLFKKIQPLLVDQQAPLELVLRFVISVLPLSLMYTVPWGFLSAVLLVFGRLSSEQEITGFRVGGISLYRLAAPVFVIGALLSLLSLWLNVNVVPTSKETSLALLYQQASEDPDSLLKPGVVQGDLGDNGESLKLLIEGRQDGWVEGFHLYQLPEEPGGGHSYVHADRASLSVDDVKNQLRIKLEDAYFETREPGKPVQMAFAGLAEPLLIDLKDPKSRKLRASAMTNEQIRHVVATNDTIPEAKKVKMRSEITKRYSFSMACLAFAFIAVPLGLGSRRRESSGGLILSLVIGTGYFLFTIIAEQFETDSAATAILWAPNIACILIGLFLFRRARFK